MQIGTLKMATTQTFFTWELLSTGELCVDLCHDPDSKMDSLGVRIRTLVINR